MKKLNLHLTILLTFVFVSVHAQFDCSNWGLGLDFNIKKPLGELEENGLTTLFGGNTEIFYLGLRSKNFIFAPGLRFSAGSTLFKYGETTNLEFPQGGTATQRLSVEHGNILLATRFIYTKFSKFSPYAELYKGKRGTTGYDRLRLDQRDLEGFENSTRKLFSSSNAVHGVAFGGLLSISKNTFLNLKVSYEWTNAVRHLDTTSSAAYSTNSIVTENTRNLGLNIGVFTVLGCPSTRRRRVSRCGSRRFYTPHRTITRPQRARSVIRT